MESLEEECCRVGKDLTATAPASYLTEISPLPAFTEGIAQTQFKPFSPFWGTLLCFLTGPSPREYSQSTTHMHFACLQRKLSTFFSWFSNDSLSDVKFCDSNKCLLWIPKGSARVSKELMQILELPNFLQGIGPDLASYLLLFPQRISEISDSCILHITKLKSNYRQLSCHSMYLSSLYLSSFSQKSTGISYIHPSSILWAYLFVLICSHSS